MIRHRHRKDIGNLKELAESIRDEGLLQPIGITEDKGLVFGERRLRAVRDILKRDTIEARTVKVSSIAAGEYAENEVRKDFTPTERDAIRRTLEQGLTLPDGGDRRKQKQVAHRPPGKTRDIAAKKAGFTSTTQARRVAKVVEKGSPELVEAMDAGKVSIARAAEIAGKPDEAGEVKKRKMKPSFSLKTAIESFDKHLKWQVKKCPRNMHNRLRAEMLALIKLHLGTGKILEGRIHNFSDTPNVEH